MSEQHRPAEPLDPHDGLDVAYVDRFFPAFEYAQRLAAVRADMAEQGLDALLVVSPCGRGS